MSPVSTGAAPGKVILFGEHAVVYGRPAIAAALGVGLGATAEPAEDGPVLHIPAWGQGGLVVRPRSRPDGFESIGRGFRAALEAAGLSPDDAPVSVTMDGELPPGVGLGSSAAFAVALVRSLLAFRGDHPTDDAVIAAAERVEQVFHGTPSGLDHTIATIRGCVWFERATAERPAVVRRLEVGAPVDVVVGWTPREGVTREVVARLRARHDAHPDVYEPLFDAMGAVAAAGAEALASGDRARLGALMDVAHGYLNACGVSNVANERMVDTARRHGALGAKLTGAGSGGAVLALPEDGRPRTAQRLVDAFEADGFQAFATRIKG